MDFGENNLYDEIFFKSEHNMRNVYKMFWIVSKTVVSRLVRLHERECVGKNLCISLLMSGTVSVHFWPVYNLGRDRIYEVTSGAIANYGLHVTRIPYVRSVLLISCGSPWQTMQCQTTAVNEAKSFPYLSKTAQYFIKYISILISFWMHRNTPLTEIGFSSLGAVFPVSSTVKLMGIFRPPSWTLKKIYLEF